MFDLLGLRDRLGGDSLGHGLGGFGNLLGFRDGYLLGLCDRLWRFGDPLGLRDRLRSDGDALSLSNRGCLLYFGLGPIVVRQVALRSRHTRLDLLVYGDRLGLGVGALLSFGDGFLDCGGHLLGLSSDFGFILGDGFDVRHKRSLDIGMIKRSRLDVCMSIGADFSLGDCLLFQLLLLLLLDVLVVIDRSMILGGCFAVIVVVASFDRGRSEFWISAGFLHIHLHNIRWFSLEA